MSDLSNPTAGFATGHPEGRRADQLHWTLRELLVEVAELEAAAVVSFDGLPMAAALPPGMDEDRVAAMSAALLSLGERASQGLGRGELSQVYIEGEAGTVFLVSADGEAVLVAVASPGAKAGLMLYEVRRTAAAIAAVLRVPADHVATEPRAVEPLPEPQPQPQPQPHPEPLLAPVLDQLPAPDTAALWDTQRPEPQVPAQPTAAPVEAREPVPSHRAEPARGDNGHSPLDPAWSSYPTNSTVLPGEPGPWS